MLLSDKQTEFVREAHHRWNFKGGATRSGKTYLDFRWIIPIRIRERIGKEGLTVILGVTKSTIERNVLEPMRNIYGDELVGTISSDNRIWLFGERCYALGAEKITQVSKIRGASIKYCYGDEVADWSIEVFELLKSRLDKAYSCFDGTFNPQYPSHWLKTFLDSDADIFSQTYTIDDNPFLPPEFIENLKREYAGSVYYKRYILGEWSLAEGMIYPGYSSALETPFTPPRWRDVFISIDYGTQNAFAALLWGKSEGVWHIFREYRYSGRDTRNQMQQGFCAIQNTLNSNTRDVIDNQNANSRAILDFLTQDKIATLQAENTDLRRAASQDRQSALLTTEMGAQTAQIINALRQPVAVPAYQVPNPYTGGYGYGCAANAGCSC